MPTNRAGRGDYRTRDDQQRLRTSGETVPFFIGKPTEALTVGLLTDKQVQPWKGPAHSPDEEVGSPRDVHYSTGDFGTGDYVVVTRYRGKWYVSCLPTS
jgi:hypothetical protein